MPPAATVFWVCRAPAFDPAVAGSSAFTRPPQAVRSPDIERGPHAAFDGGDAQEHPHGGSDPPGASDDATHILGGHFQFELDLTRTGALRHAHFGRVVDQRARHIFDETLH